MSARPSNAPDLLSYDPETDMVAIPFPGGSWMGVNAGLLLKTIEKGGGGRIERRRAYGSLWRFVLTNVVTFAVGVGLMFLSWPSEWATWKVVVYAVGTGLAGAGTGGIRDFRYARALRAKGGAR